jgi:hypothetical protein
MVHTIFHRTHVSLKKWFWAIFLVGTDKRGCSAKRLEKLIGVHYETAWLMIHKISHAIENSDSFYKLTNFIKMDESYFGGYFSGKRGRGAANKSTVVVAVKNRGTKPGVAALEVINIIHSNHIKILPLE